jgi:hypothetical protein
MVSRCARELLFFLFLQEQIKGIITLNLQAREPGFLWKSDPDGVGSVHN